MFESNLHGAAETNPHIVATARDCVNEQRLRACPRLGRERVAACSIGSPESSHTSSGYATDQSVSPCAGAVGPAAARSHAASASPTQSAFAPPDADLDERPDDDAHHRVQERVARRHACTRHLSPRMLSSAISIDVDPAHRALALARTRRRRTSGSRARRPVARAALRIASTIERPLDPPGDRRRGTAAARVRSTIR